MIVVADTSPLNYLILIGHIEVLEDLYGVIAVPDAVRAEMLRADAPAVVRSWATYPPHWVQLHSVTSNRRLSSNLDAGELEAISLALSLKAPVIIIDERIGRAEAQMVGLKVIGTLGILRDAHEAGLVDLSIAMERLKATNFRIAAHVLADLLDVAPET